jgi:hypothetical protein
MGSRVRVQDASPDLRGAFLPLRRASRCRAESGTILCSGIEPPPEDWWRSHGDLEWQAPELPLDDGQVLVLDAEDPFPADEWPVYRAD